MVYGKCLWSSSFTESFVSTLVHFFACVSHLFQLKQMLRNWCALWSVSLISFIRVNPCVHIPKHGVSQLLPIAKEFLHLANTIRKSWESHHLFLVMWNLIFRDQLQIPSIFFAAVIFCNFNTYIYVCLLMLPFTLYTTPDFIQGARWS